MGRQVEITEPEYVTDPQQRITLMCVVLEGLDHDLDDFITTYRHTGHWDWVSWRVVLGRFKSMLSYLEGYW